MPGISTQSHANGGGVDSMPSRGTAASSAAYRADIDGLRAIAVLAVVLYHLGIGQLNGGFVGVDIFYVISGFLITGIIKREIELGRFTFSGFYQRRVRRLFPALFVVILATLLAGFLILLPTDLEFLGKSTIATLVFSSNIFFWRNSGYFDASSENNPLLHTWSLSVEEQFYIVFPTILLLIHRYARNRLKALLFAATCLSLLACVYEQAERPTATFFLLPFRAWELSMGALLAADALPAMTRRWPRELVALVGALLIAYAVLHIQPGIEFPGWRAVLPVVGAALVIHAGSSGSSTVQAILGFRPLVYIGMISYSLYLWHWPLLVYAKYLNQLMPLGPVRYAILLAAIVFAALSYHWVEKPLRRPWRGSRSGLLFPLAFGLSGVLVLAGLGLARSGGMPTRLPQAVVALDKERTLATPFLDCMDRPLNEKPFHGLCVMGDRRANPTVLFWGDSHSLSWYPAMDEVLKKKGVAAIFGGWSSCAPLIGIINPAEIHCHDHNAEVMEYLHELPAISSVILVASWAGYSNEPGKYTLHDDAGNQGNKAVFSRALRLTVDEINAMGKRVWLIGPTSRAPTDLPLRMALAAQWNAPPPQAVSAEAYDDQMQAFYLASSTLVAERKVSLTNPGPWLCDERRCRYEIAGRPLFRDDGHLNLRGARYLGPKLEAAYDVFLKGG